MRSLKERSARVPQKARVGEKHPPTPCGARRKPKPTPAWGGRILKQNYNGEGLW